MKVCHITSVHDSTDTRIFLKECVTLAQNGYDTWLVAPGNSYEKEDVHIIGIGEVPPSRLERIRKMAKKAYMAALKTDADVYHFHDPELLPYGLKLKKKNKIVIYDSHEDVPRQILAKDWLPVPIRGTISMVFDKYEKYAARKLDYVVTATPHIKKIFRIFGAKAIDIKNYPVLEDIKGDNTDYFNRGRTICYAGGLTEVRGITSLVDAAEKADVKLLLAGDMEKRYEEQLRTHRGFEHTEYRGYLDRDGIAALYKESRIGIAVLKPTPNHVNALAIKLFEYMAAGLPVVCSDFPLWKQIVEENGCGICVNPEDTDQIAEAVKYLIDKPKLAKEMGDRGQKAAEEKYQWSTEARRLLKLYRLVGKHE